MKYIVKTLRKFVKTTVIISIFSFYLFPVMYLQADEVAILSQAVNHEDLIVRLSAIKALGELRDVRAVGSLIAALKDESPIVRRDAAIALGHIKDAGAVEPLIDALKDKDAIVRMNAVTALGEIGKSAIEALIANILD